MKRAWTSATARLRGGQVARRAAPLLAALAVLAAAGCSSRPPAAVTPRAPALAAPTTQPALEVTCPTPFVGPADGRLLDVTFGYQAHVRAPFRVRIDYGDGRVYANDAAHLSLVFAHAYATPGSRTVSATLTDAAGTSTRATCVFDWRPAAAGSATPTTG